LRYLRKHGWEYADSSIRKDRKSEIYVSSGPSDLLCRVWLDPFSNPGSLRIRLRTTSKAKRNVLFERLHSETARSEIPSGRFLAVVAEPQSTYKQAYPWSVEVRVNWTKLLGRSTRRTIPNALKRFVLRLMTTVDPASLGE
jgi:hypothetical protein